MRETFSRWLRIGSGADLPTLDRPECAIDRGKYEALGMTLFITAILASLSGGYASWTAFRSVPIAVLLGLLWGLTVFTLDRAIATSMRKARIDPGTPPGRKVALWAGMLLMALPRVALAMLIALTLSVPLELAVFAPEIEAELALEAARGAAAAEVEVEKEFTEIPELERKNTELRGLVTAKEKERDDLRDKVSAEHAGLAGAGLTGIPKDGPHYRFLQAELGKVERELNGFRQEIGKQIDVNAKRLAKLIRERDQRLSDIKNRQRQANGFLARLKALDHLARQNTAVAWACRLLSLLMLTLETGPLLLKCMMPAGVYEAVLERLERETVAEQDRQLLEGEEDADAQTESRRRTRGALLTWKQNQLQKVQAEAEKSSELKAARRNLVKEMARHLKESLEASCLSYLLSTRNQVQQAVRATSGALRKETKHQGEIERHVETKLDTAIATAREELEGAIKKHTTDPAADLPVA